MHWLPGWQGFQCQPWDVIEDGIVGDEGDTKTQGGSGHPSIGVVVPLAQGMADAFAGNAELGIDKDEIRTRVHDLSLVVILASSLSIRVGPQPRLSAP